jgi:hypothetical protein
MFLPPLHHHRLPGNQGGTALPAPGDEDPQGRLRRGPGKGGLPGGPESKVQNRVRRPRRGRPGTEHHPGRSGSNHTIRKIVENKPMELRSTLVRNVIQIMVFSTFLEYAFSQESEVIKTDEKSLYPALVGGLFTNTVFHLTSRLFGADFAQTSMESIKTNFASNALDWSFKWKHTFKINHIELKAHIGWTFFGSSEFYPFAEMTGTDLNPHETENDYGTGGNIKIFFRMKTQKYGEVSLSICNYLLLIIPLNKPESSGIEYLNLSSLGYAYPLTKNFSLIADNSLYIKSGRSPRETNVVSIANRLFLGALYTFIEK